MISTARSMRRSRILTGIHGRYNVMRSEGWSLGLGRERRRSTTSALDQLCPATMPRLDRKAFLEKSMRNFDEFTVTDAVLHRMENTKDRRAKQISEALVRHLHAFVREIEPTQAEWEAGIDFLTRTGQMCSEKRQEFILLSDVLGVSMLVDAITHRSRKRATETTVLGPFFVKGAPEYAHGDDISGGMAGDPLLVTGLVLDAWQRPIAGATVDVWHSDDEGYYDVQHTDLAEQLAMKGRLRTDENG